MAEPVEPWGVVVARLGLAAVSAVEDGLLYAHASSTSRIELVHRAFRDPPTVRVRVSPAQTGASFLIVPRRVLASRPRWLTGDEAFDAEVAIVAGGSAVLHRLGRREREELLELVGRHHATIGGSEATLEPAVTERMTDAVEAAKVVHALARLAVRLVLDPPIEDLLERWLLDEGAPGVESALSDRIMTALPTLTESQAELACRLLIDRLSDPPTSVVAQMPPYPVVLRAWFRIGDPLDPRIADRVEEAFLLGSPRPLARYLGWVMAEVVTRPEVGPLLTRLVRIPGLRDDAAFAREFVRTIRAGPPAAARELLQELEPSSSAVAKRVAPVLATFRHRDADARLVQWLPLPGSGVRRAAAQALADRAVEMLHDGDRDGLERISGAARRSGALITALVDAVPQEHTAWLASLRPHGEPDAITLIRRLGQGGADVDDPLMYWLDRGTRAVRLEAAAALGAAGSPRAAAMLKERATGWLELFGDAAVREACRKAADQIRVRAGGRGNLAVAGVNGGDLAEAQTGGQLSED